MNGPIYDELQTDALTELVNIAVSGSAVRLRGMIGQEVTLSVPAVATLPPSEAAKVMAELGLSDVVAVRQSFEGGLEGETLLIIPQPGPDDLLGLVLEDVTEQERSALEEDALKEIGNVLLTGFLSSIGNMLREDFEVAIPTLSHGSARELFEASDREVVLLIYINFGVRKRTVRGYFAMVLGLSSLNALKQMLNRFLVQAGLGAA